MKPFAIFWIGLCVVAVGQDELQPVEVGDRLSPSMMENWLQRKAFAALDRREAELEKLNGEESLRSWQTERREAFINALGGFPERTPLNAKVTGKLDFEGHRIEKLYFESQPGLHVTATLYLPLGEGPFPAVLHPTGHSASAKSRDLYQEASIVIAKGGCAVLCYDPVGQG
ncbi:MAG: metalloendopeptidase, partial [Verrucomicrobiota bacterium]